MYIDVTKKRGSYTRELVKELSVIRELFYDKGEFVIAATISCRQLIHNSLINCVDNSL